MIDPARSLMTIRTALGPITRASSDEDSTATEAAERELALVASAVAEIANQLDDGTGFSNSSVELRTQLARHFDDVRRRSTVMGLLDGLAVPEVLQAVRGSPAEVHVRVGPHAVRRVLLTEDDRAAIERISAMWTDILLDAAMPTDPEDEDEPTRP